MTILSDEEWIIEFERANSSPAKMAHNTGLSLRQIFMRRNSLRGKGHSLDTNQQLDASRRPKWAYPRLARLTLEDGTVIIYSDAHYWPGEPPTPAFDALVTLCYRLKPEIVIANGDLGDFASIGRHPQAGWAKRPAVSDELDEIRERQAEIAAAAAGAIFCRTVANHDLRFDAYLANNSEAYAGVAGTRFADHLPDWPESWMVKINDDLHVKHRWHGGVHAAWNNVLKGQGSIATGHTHSLYARPLCGFSGRFWGIETGHLGIDPLDTKDEGSGGFEYAESSPTPTWMPGFVVLTYRHGVMLPPEFCAVDKGIAYFRGEAVVNDVPSQSDRRRRPPAASDSGDVGPEDGGADR